MRVGAWAAAAATPEGSASASSGGIKVCVGGESCQNGSGRLIQKQKTRMIAEKLHLISWYLLGLARAGRPRQLRGCAV